MTPGRASTDAQGRASAQVEAREARAARHAARAASTRRRASARRAHRAAGADIGEGERARAATLRAEARADGATSCDRLREQREASAPRSSPRGARAPTSARRAALAEVELAAARPARSGSTRSPPRPTRLELKLHGAARRDRRTSRRASPSATASSSRRERATTTTCARSSARSRRRALRELRELIERMGEINLTAIEEFEELQKRFEFLPTQKARSRAARRRSSRRRSSKINTHVAQALPRDVRRGQRQVPGGLPAAVPRRAAPRLALTDEERPARDRHRDHRPAAGQEERQNGRAALGRREGADRGLAASSRSSSSSRRRSASSTRSTRRSTRPTSAASTSSCAR